MNYLLVYLWTRLGTINGVLIAFMMLTCAILMFHVVASLIGPEEYQEWRNTESNKFFNAAGIRRLVWVFFISMFLCLITPSQKDILYIYILPRLNDIDMESVKHMINTVQEMLGKP